MEPNRDEMSACSWALTAKPRERQEAFAGKTVCWPPSFIKEAYP